MQIYSQAHFSIYPLASPWLEQVMVEQRFDLGLGETTQAPPGVDLQRLLSVNEVAVLPQGHRLARKNILHPADFEGGRFISLAADDPYRHAMDQLFAEAGVERNACLETASAWQWARWSADLFLHRCRASLEPSGSGGLACRNCYIFYS